EPLAVDGMRCFMFASATIAVTRTAHAMRALSRSRERGQGLASSAAEGETMLAGTVPGETPMGAAARSASFVGHAYERPDLPVGRSARSRVRARNPPFA